MRTLTEPVLKGFVTEIEVTTIDRCNPRLQQRLQEPNHLGYKPVLLGLRREFPLNTKRARLAGQLLPHVPTRLPSKPIHALRIHLPYAMNRLQDMRPLDLLAWPFEHLPQRWQYEINDLLQPIEWKRPMPASDCSPSPRQRLLEGHRKWRSEMRVELSSEAKNMLRCLNGRQPQIASESRTELWNG